MAELSFTKQRVTARVLQAFWTCGAWRGHFMDDPAWRRAVRQPERLCLAGGAVFFAPFRLAAKLAGKPAATATAARIARPGVPALLQRARLPSLPSCLYRFPGMYCLVARRF